jgi:hypothetical protein
VKYRNAVSVEGAGRWDRVELELNETDIEEVATAHEIDFSQLGPVARFALAQAEVTRLLMTDVVSKGLLPTDRVMPSIQKARDNIAALAHKYPLASSDDSG